MGGIISDAINGFFTDLGESLFKMINKLLVSLLDICFNSEHYMTTIGMKTFSLDKVSGVILKFALVVIVIKFLQKAFFIYIVQSDGDPDADPAQLLIGFFQSIAISVTFMSLYTPLINALKDFANQMLKAMSGKTEAQMMGKLVFTNLVGSAGIADILLIIIYLILVLILYIKFIQNGLELMVLKLSIPFLSVGLMDSDGGVFKTGIKKFFQIGFTCLIQIVLLRMSIALLVAMHPIWSVAAAVTALSTPKLMQDLLFVRMGGGAMGKLYGVNMIRSMVAR